MESRLEEYNLILQKNDQLKSPKINKLIAKPRVILPPSDLVLKSEQLKQSSQKNLKKKNCQGSYKKLRSYSSKSIAKKNSLKLTDTARTNSDKKIEFNEYDPNILKISKNEENKFEEKEDIYLNTFGSKDNFFTLSENSFKINKINNFFRRKYLSKNWEESLRNVDEEFVILSKKANDIIKNVYKTTRRIFNVDFCSHCCAQKSKIPTKKKTKNLLIDSLISYGNYRKKFIGSVTLNSPLQSLPASEHSFSQEVTLSEDKLIKKNIICGSIIIDGKLINQIGGICKDRLHILHKIPYSERIKNILPCNCYCTEENEEENQTANKIDKLKCQQCFDAINSSLKNFLVKKNIEEQTFQQIDHTTCTQRFYTDEKKVEENKKECCIKCINFPEKCKRSKNFFEEILKFGDEEKLKEDKIKLYKNSIKFSIKGLKKIDGGDGESCQHIISNVMLCTPKIITPISSKSGVTVYSSLSQNNFGSETKLNDGKKLIGKQKIAKIISDNKNKVKEEMMELYKQIEELDNIKNKLNKNLEVIKIDPMIKDTGVIKKRSKKKIVGKNIKIKKKFISSKKIVDNEANGENFEENLETSKNVIKKQIVDVKNNMAMEEMLITSEDTEDTDSYSEKFENEKNSDKNSIEEEKKNEDLSKHKNLITLMKVCLNLLIIFFKSIGDKNNSREL